MSRLFDNNSPQSLSRKFLILLLSTTPIFTIPAVVQANNKRPFGSGISRPNSCAVSIHC